MAKSYRFYEFSVLKCNSNESATKGDNAMSKKIRTEAVDYLFQGILSLEDKEECYTFFEDICTINELLSLSQRFEVAKMLREHKTYLEIAEKTGASTATISRVNRSLNYGNDGYDMVSFFSCLYLNLSYLNFSFRNEADRGNYPIIFRQSVFLRKYQNSDYR